MHTYIIIYDPVGFVQYKNGSNRVRRLLCFKLSEVVYWVKDSGGSLSLF